MNEPKPPQSAEKSLSYISWTLKDICKEINDLNETMKAVKTCIEDIKTFGVPR